MRAKKAKSRNSFTEGYKTYDTSEGYGDEREWRDAFYTRMTGEEARKILEEQDETDPYVILGLTRGVTIDVIKRKFRTLAIELHEDKLRARGASESEIEEAGKKLQNVTAAYTILDNELRKARQ